ncbi:MAG: hypothetical protein KDD42_05620, partial [Bdellovibrionales bacterium]|nr:hypothetical protein [Bdellovibrionales bacterium]
MTLDFQFKPVGERGWHMTLLRDGQLILKRKDFSLGAIKPRKKHRKIPAPGSLTPESEHAVICHDLLHPLAYQICRVAFPNGSSDLFGLSTEFVVTALHSRLSLGGDIIPSPTNYPRNERHSKSPATV